MKNEYRQKWLEEIYDYCDFSNIPYDLMSDREFVLEAVKKNPNSFAHASEEIRNDRDIVMTAVSGAGYTLEYVSEELRNDRDVVIAAVKRHGFVLKYASRELRNDCEIVKAAVNERWESLEYASEELRNDRDIVLDALNDNGSALEFASDELRNDRQIVLEATKIHFRAFQYASEALHNDPDILEEIEQKETAYYRSYNDESDIGRIVFYLNGYGSNYKYKTGNINIFKIFSVTTDSLEIYLKEEIKIPFGTNMAESEKEFIKVAKKHFSNKESWAKYLIFCNNAPQEILNWSYCSDGTCQTLDWAEKLNGRRFDYDDTDKYSPTTKLNWRVDFFPNNNRIWEAA